MNDTPEWFIFDQEITNEIVLQALHAHLARKSLSIEAWEVSLGQEPGSTERILTPLQERAINRNRKIVASRLGLSYTDFHGELLERAKNARS